MKKAFDQTVRDIKRGVNKKVLKVPTIEQKVLDATSNEPWGPHGSLLADIALASRNYHEYQMIMSVIWKRVNDTGKNWRHVYKGLTVLEYLVANGSERVINEIREHAYQITTLSEFQYIDHNAKDQGSNVRKKSQSLVALVNDKEKIQEVRQKAAANWDKFHSTSGGARNRPGSYPGPGGFDDDRYGSRDEDRNNGYGREREWGDDKYGEERYGRDRYRDDEYRGRRSVDGDNYGRRSRSSDRERERAYEDEGQYSSRGSYAKTDDQSQDGRPLERRSSEQNLGVPPSYEDAVGGGRSPVYNERDGEVKSSPPPVTAKPETTVSSSPEAPAAAPPPVAVAPPPPAAATSKKEHNGFDEFDPRGSFPAAPPTSAPPTSEMDLFGSSSDAFSVNALALVPTTAATSVADAFTDSNQTFVAAPSASVSSSQPFEDPFGDGPFRAVSSTDGFSAPPPQSTTSVSVFGQNAEPPRPVSESGNNFGYGGGYDSSTDILADLLPPVGPSQTSFQTQPSQLPSQTSFPSQTGFPVQPNEAPFPPSFQGQPGQPTPHQDGFHPHGGFQSQMGSVSQTGFPGSNGQPSNVYGGFDTPGSSAPVPHMAAQVTTAPAAPKLNASSFYQQQQSPALTASSGALVIVPQEPAKFETKSTVWADTLNRGLVNLNIAGSKTNPLSDIGVDFEALNRKEKRMEKPSMTPMVSNVSMGKAMGSGSGIGRAGAGALRPQPNPMMGSGMAGPGGYGAGYGGMNQQPMGQFQMQPPSGGFPPGPAMAGNYNTMMGRGGGGYGQQPYGGGYR